jgi:hypothetical protein
MNIIQGIYEAPRYFNDGLRSKEISISNEFTFKQKLDGEIVVAFLYDLCLEHYWNKKDSHSIYGGYIAGNPKVNSMTYFYQNENWEVRNPSMPSDEINPTSLASISATSSFYFVVETNYLNSAYKKVHTIQFNDSESVRTTYLNYYMKIVDGTTYLKEEFEFSTNKRDRSNVIIKRKYKYAITNFTTNISIDGTVPLKFHQGSAVHSVKLTNTRVTKPSMIFKKGNEVLYGSLVKKHPGFDTFKFGEYYLSNPIGMPGIVLRFEMQMAEYRSHAGVGGRFRRIQVFNSSGEDITDKCYFDTNRFWYSIYDHKYHQHWPTDDRWAAMNQVKVGFDGNYNTVMQGIAYSSKNHTANGWIRAFLVCPPDEYIEKVIYQFGDWHRNVTYRLGYYNKDNVYKTFENFWISGRYSNFDKEYHLDDYR